MTENVSNNIFSKRALAGLAAGTAVALGMYVGGWIASGRLGYDYLLPNLALAYIPLALTYPLVQAAAKWGWRDVRTLGWAGLWLLFLPNSFYVTTDILHLQQHSYGLNLGFGLVMFGWFGVLGMAAGLLSVWRVQRQWARRLSQTAAYWVAELVLLASSVGIYLGHTQRWNSWDVVTRPMGLAMDVVKLFVAPPMGAAVTVAFFFALLSGLYAAVWRVWGKQAPYTKR